MARATSRIGLPLDLMKHRKRAGLTVYAMEMKRPDMMADVGESARATGR
jgi:hypothetical protein